MLGAVCGVLSAVRHTCHPITPPPTIPPRSLQTPPLVSPSTTPHHCSFCHVQCFSPQEEYLLDPAKTLRLVGRMAKEGGVRAVSDSVYPYLSLAAETFLSQLLNSMVKMRLQREDLGR